MLLASAVLLTLVGCATARQKAANTEDLLAASGFTQRVATTPEAQAKLQGMTPLKMQRMVKDGQITYVYPDPEGCNCAYVGNERQYGEFRRLAIEEKIAEENFETARATPYGPANGWW
jgi:hypothetical protein